MRVLLVDHNRDNNAMLSILLGRVGCEVQVATCGVDALTIVAAFTPDVICLDLVLPQSNGYQLASELRRHPQLGRARIIAISGYVIDAERASEAGIDNYFLKPVAFDLLARVIRPR